ncbi:hypothetical protein [Dysgonomonas capnocytophagoides]|uniref:hypothetical protein n=1 Tax=Dysgonomonas capnocytophagoides TaxID=45254 RepID=UPI002924F952|nr:hypothetical protein DCPSUM001_33760 [Dysgonomonas capnocytophagoides]
MARIHTQIRLERVARRLNKVSYSSDLKIRVIEKLIERNEILQKDIDRTWAVMYSRGFKAGIDNTNSIFFDDFDFILLTEKQLEKNNKRIDKGCTSLGITEEQILKDKYLRNAGKASQSF